MDLKLIDPILKRISVLFYIFVGLFVVGTVYSIVRTVMMKLETESVPTVGHSTFETILLVMLALMLLLVSVVTLVVFIRLLVVIGKSIARKNIFSLEIVKFVNIYAILYLSLLCLIFVVIFVFKDLGAIEQIDASTIISEISTLVMLLMLGQVIKIGCILKQEQELTI